MRLITVGSTIVFIPHNIHVPFGSNEISAGNVRVFSVAIDNDHVIVIKCQVNTKFAPGNDGKIGCGRGLPDPE